MPTYLGKLGRFAQCPHVREHTLFEACQDHDRELQPLRGVQGHQRDDAAAGVGHRVGVRHQRHLLEERVQRGDLAGADALLLELTRHADQLAQVVDPRLVLRIPAGLQLPQVPGPIQHRLEHRGRRCVRPGSNAA
jgi:hypothetical protein